MFPGPNWLISHAPVAPSLHEPQLLFFVSRTVSTGLEKVKLIGRSFR